MKTFKVPEVEVVYFGHSDLIVTSSCLCDSCEVCPEGSNDCRCWDFAHSYTNE